jgi:hypothetical protein
MKQLMEHWRRYVSLNEGIDPRIKKQLDALLRFPEIGVAITSDGFGKAFRYIFITDPEAEHPQFMDMAFPGDMTPAKLDAEGLDDYDYYQNPEKYEIYGQVEIYKSEPQGDGECYDVHIIMATNAADGWGPLLYEVALEWASQRGGGLTADRAIVSDEAQAVWAKYEKRGDVDAKQMDIDHTKMWDKDGLPKKRKQFPHLTPDKPEDDCDQSKAIQVGKEKWADTPLSKMYYKPNADVMKALKAAGRLIEV